MAFKFTSHKDIPKAVKVWLFIGLVMIFFQIVIGGITRLTGSGLSITKWEIVTGTLPPLNAEQWEEAFDLYKETPQYAKINEGMSMSEFKFIYFWEYIHRLWARSMGFVFLIPFLFFWWQGWFSKKLLRQLVVVFLMAALVASFGWIMVASGLIDRPWVNAYKLSFHLSLALILFSYLLWITLGTLRPTLKVINNNMLKNMLITLLVILAFQLFIGGMMSGMKAGLLYPEFPTMNGQWIPDPLLKTENWNVENLVHYDRSLFMPALVQFIHRSIAYLLVISVLYFFFQARKAPSNQQIKRAEYLLVIMLVIQVTLGVLTVINCVGEIPVLLGVLHQAFAVLLLSALLYNLFLRVDNSG